MIGSIQTLKNSSLQMMYSRQSSLKVARIDRVTATCSQQIPAKTKDHIKDLRIIILALIKLDLVLQGTIPKLIR